MFKTNRNVYSPRYWVAFGAEEVRVVVSGGQPSADSFSGRYHKYVGPYTSRKKAHAVRKQAASQRSDHGQDSRTE